MAMAKDVLEQLRVDPGEKFRIADHDAKWLPPAAHEVDKAERKRIAEMMLADNKVELAEAQELLYADGRHSVLIVFQAMDAAGKDGTIGHVMSGVNPQGCSVSSFKVPSAEEFSHTYLWRYSKALPARGMIGIFNRSYYEEVLVVKVHPAILDKADLPPEDVHKDIWKHRYEDINNFEQHLSRNGTTILKFFLNVSQGGAEEALPRAPRHPREELEVQLRRHRRARLLGRLHGGLRGCDQRHEHTMGALVRDSRRSQVGDAGCGL
jgi:polyphosphate kinase 2 (PPK2 family)